MASQLLKGHTYNSGDIVDATDLNAHVDSAVARLTGGLVSEQPSVVAAAGDYVLISDASDSGNLKKALVSSLGTGVTSVGLTMPSPFSVAGSPVTTTGTLTVTIPSQAANKVYAAPPSSSGAPSFRVLTAADVSPLHSDIAAFTIDWSLSNVFAKVMPDNGIHHFSFTNVRDGQSIMVRVQQWSSGGTSVAHWDNVDYWRAGGVEPVLTTGPSAKDIYFFTAIGSAVYGYSHQNFA